MTNPTISDRYDILERLGEGGMATVYRAWDRQLGRAVALKCLRDSGAVSASIRQRFQREAQATAQLSHPNVVALYDVGESGDQMYIVMELVEGSSLAATLNRRRPNDLRPLLALLEKVARGVHHAHQHGIVHRDLKPGNILVTAAGEPKVADFGLAFVGEGSSITRTGTLVGTPMYMAPEQVAGRHHEITPRTDVYALGAILYQILCGHAPHVGTTPMEVYKKVLSEDPASVRQSNPRVDTDLETITLKAIAKEPKRRYPSAEAFAEDLRRYLAGEPIRARPYSIVYRISKLMRRHSGAVAALGLFALAIAAAAALPLVQSSLARQREEAARRDRAAAAAARLAGAEETLAQGEAAAAQQAAEKIVADYASYAAAGENLPIARARLLAARTLAAQGQEAGSISEFARAYRDGAASSERSEREAAADALFEIGRRFERRLECERARGAYRTLLARFPDLAITAQARHGLACALQALGQPEAALVEFREAMKGENLSPGDRAQAAEAVAILSDLTPVIEAVLPPGAHAFGDLDGDGVAEIVTWENSGRMAVHRLHENRFGQIAEARVGPDEPNNRDILVADIDADGANEIVATWGNSDGSKRGRLHVLEWTQGALKEGPGADLGSHSAGMRAADLDQDGQPELIVGIGMFVRQLHVYHYRPDGRFARPFGARFNNSDIRDFIIGDFDPGPGLEVLISLGPWGDWRICLLRWDGTSRTFEALSSLPQRSGIGNLAALPDGTVLFRASMDPSYLKPMTEVLQIPPADILADGLYSVTLAGGNFGDPRLLFSPDQSPDLLGSVKVGGRDFLACVEATPRREVLRLRTLALGVTPHILASRDRLVDPTMSPAWHDLDRDGKPELIVGSGSGAKTLRIFGLGRAVEAPPTEAAREATHEDLGGDLLGLGLVAEAREEFRRKNDCVGVGRTFMEERLWHEAAEALAQEKNRKGRALKLRADCFEQLRDWRSLVATIDTLLERTDVDALEREALARRRLMAREAAAMEERARCESLLRGPALASDNPLMCRPADGVLEVWQTGADASATGVPLWYGGGPLRLEWEIEVLHAKWNAAVSTGLAGESILAVAFWNGGSSQDPVPYASLRFRAADDTGAGADLGNDAFVPEAGTACRITLEYIPGFNRAWAQIECGQRRHALGIAVPRPLARGFYRFGAVRLPDAPAGNAQFSCAYRIRDARLYAHDPSIRFEAPEPKSAAEFLAAANGDFICGREERALSRYAEALSWAGPRETNVVVRARLFRAILHLRRDRAAASREDLRAAFSADRGATQDLVAASAPGLSEEELKFVLSAR